MSDEAENSTFTMTLAGREVTFRKTGLGQVIMLQRRAMRAMRAADEQSAADKRVDLAASAMVQVLDFIEKLIVHEDDRQFVEDQMLEGTIEWEDLVKALGGGGAKEPVADDQPPRPVKKAPKKISAAKTVASRGRTKR